MPTLNELLSSKLSLTSSSVPLLLQYASEVAKILWTEQLPGGVTVASALAKVLEFLILEIEVEHSTFRSWCSSCKPNSLSQTSWLYWCNFWNTSDHWQFVIHAREGSTVHMWLPVYDLQKAFDLVELPVLFDCLFSIGINRKTWRIVKNWYEGGSDILVVWSWRIDSLMPFWYREVCVRAQFSLPHCFSLWWILSIISKPWSEDKWSVCKRLSSCWQH